MGEGATLSDGPFRREVGIASHKRWLRVAKYVHHNVSLLASSCQSAALAFRNPHRVGLWVYCMKETTLPPDRSVAVILSLPGPGAPGTSVNLSDRSVLVKPFRQENRDREERG